MSEYQYVIFQAVDGPLNDKQLEFAQRQSSRAEVSRWSLSVEYQYSSFRGDIWLDPDFCTRGAASLVRD